MATLYIGFSSDVAGKVEVPFDIDEAAVPALLEAIKEEFGGDPAVPADLLSAMGGIILERQLDMLDDAARRLERRRAKQTPQIPRKAGAPVVVPANKAAKT